MEILRIYSTLSQSVCLNQAKSLSTQSCQNTGNLYSPQVPHRINFDSAKATQDANFSSVTLNYQATFNGWRSDYIPLWVNGTLQLELCEHNHLTQVRCSIRNRKSLFPQIEPLELVLWIVLVLVLATLIYRTVETPTTANSMPVFTLAFVPLFYSVTILWLRSNSRSALTVLLRQALESKSP